MSALASASSTSTSTSTTLTSRTNDSDSSSRPRSARPEGITVTHKTKSFHPTFLQGSAKPIVSKIVKPPSEQPPSGSPQLQPHESVLKQCNVRHLRSSDINIYEINSRAKSTKWLFGAATSEYSGWKPGEAQARIAACLPPVEESLCLNPTPTNDEEHPEVRCRDWAQHYDGTVRRRPRFIYYFAGGGFQSPPTSDHWKLCAHLAHTLSQKGTPTTVFLVSLPLAPASPATETLPSLVRLYFGLFPELKDDLTVVKTNDSYLSVRDTQYPEIVFAGDSTGANVALALTLHVLSVTPTAPAPESLLLVSPIVDLRLSAASAELAKAVKKDPVLTVDLLEKMRDAWCGKDVTPDDPRVSPALADLALLARHDVMVHGVVGTNDVSSVDALEFVNKLKAEGISGRWLVWEKQMHCFPLGHSNGTVEGRESVEWMMDALNDAAVAAKRRFE